MFQDTVSHLPATRNRSTFGWQNWLFQNLSTAMKIKSSQFYTALPRHPRIWLMLLNDAHLVMIDSQNPSVSWLNFCFGCVSICLIQSHYYSCIVLLPWFVAFCHQDIFIQNSSFFRVINMQRNLKEMFSEAAGARRGPKRKMSRYVLK